MLADHRLQPLAPVAAEHRPELERAEPPTEWHAVLAQADDVLAHAKVLGDEAERVAEIVGRRVKNAEQSIGVSSHLCGLTPTESARSQPAKSGRSSGHTAALPA